MCSPRVDIGDELQLEHHDRFAASPGIHGLAHDDIRINRITWSNLQGFHGGKDLAQVTSFSSDFYSGSEGSSIADGDSPQAQWIQMLQSDGPFLLDALMSHIAWLEFTGVGKDPDRTGTQDRHSVADERDEGARAKTLRLIETNPGFIRGSGKQKRQERDLPHAGGTTASTRMRGRDSS